MTSSNFSSGQSGASSTPKDCGDTSSDATETQAGERVINQLIRPIVDIKSGLYIVSTPIGNLRDITLRALDVLASVDIVLAEDTRVARKLMNAYGLNPILRPYHDHNGAKVRPAILRDLDDGKSIALISDAGTPLISDPGYKLVRDVCEQGHYVTALPGASALLASLTISGLPSDQFIFAGFPPVKQGARQKFYQSLSKTDATLIFYEGPSRLVQSLADMAQAFSGREAVLARELTKRFEEAIRLPLSELAAHIEESGPPKGELVILIGPPGEAAVPDQMDLDEAIRLALQTLSLKEAAAFVASEMGLKKREVYNRALELKDGD